MTHADAFLQDIFAHPDDDAPRLIFADWLEEQGGANSVARAEFIRVQCALATGNVPDCQRVELVRREQQILDEWGKEWVRPIHRLVQTWEFHRGFIHRVGMVDDKFFAHAGRLFRRAPIQHLSIRARMSPQSYPHFWPPLNIAALADNKHLRRLRALDLSGNELGSSGVRALVVSEHLTSLTTLDLSNNLIGDSGIRALAGSRLLDRLERLNLRSNDVGAGGLRALADALEKLSLASEELRLQRLELSHHNLSTTGQRVIAESPLLRRLVLR
jgi:uncharacterized protein (TIGR02996 family)